VNRTNRSICPHTLQAGDGITQNQPIRKNAYVEANRHIGLAMDWIEEAWHAAAPVALKTCLLLLDLLTGASEPRIPVPPPPGDTLPLFGGEGVR
jgi:hypothetical protein